MFRGLGFRIQGFMRLCSILKNTSNFTILARKLQAGSSQDAVIRVVNHIRMSTRAHRSVSLASMDLHVSRVLAQRCLFSCGVSRPCALALRLRHDSTCSGGKDNSDVHSRPNQPKKHGNSNQAPHPSSTGSHGLTGRCKLCC